LKVIKLNIKYFINFYLSFKNLFPIVFHTNDSVIISYEATKDIYGGGYNSNYSSPIKLLYLAHLYKPYPLSDANPSSEIPSDVGVRYLCPTTGINTSNGVIHVLPASHSLFYSRFQ